MHLAEKLKASRLEAGLSQRQLCGDTITRNMLSQIENGAARPSMGTLQYLAQRLGKPISYFLEEQAVVSPNLERITPARAAYGQKDYTQVLAILEDFKEPDEAFGEEKKLLQYLAHLGMARQAEKPSRCLEILQAVENKATPQWNLLRAEALFAMQQYGEAATCYEKTEQTQAVFARLEACYRELGDYKRAYEYACRQK